MRVVIDLHSIDHEDGVQGKPCMQVKRKICLPIFKADTETQRKIIKNLSVVQSCQSNLRDF